MTGKHDRADGDSNLLRTGPIVVRGLARSVRDTLGAPKEGRHRRAAEDADARDRFWTIEEALGLQPGAAGAETVELVRPEPRVHVARHQLLLRTAAPVPIPVEPIPVDDEQPEAEPALAGPEPVLVEPEPVLVEPEPEPEVVGTAPAEPFPAPAPVLVTARRQLLLVPMVPTVPEVEASAGQDPAVAGPDVEAMEAFDALLADPADPRPVAPDAVPDGTAAPETDDEDEPPATAGVLVLQRTQILGPATGGSPAAGPDERDGLLPAEAPLPDPGLLEPPQTDLPAAAAAPALLLDRSDAPPEAPGRRRGGVRFGRESAAVAILVVLALVCAGLIAAVVVKTRQDQAAAAREAASYTPPALSGPTSAPALGTIAVVGDGSVTRSADGVGSSSRWPALLGRTLGSDVSTYASVGSGYTAEGSDDRSFLQQAARVPKDADVVLFVGGANDLGSSSLTLARAATRALAAAKARAPQATLVVVGPFTDEGTSDERSALRDTLRASARIVGARWIDPSAQDWLATSRASASALTAADERAVAARVAQALRGQSSSPASTSSGSGTQGA